MSYLLYAVREHSYDITKFLLDTKANPNMVSPLTSTPDVIEPHPPLEISCYDDYGMNYMKLLLEYGANPNDTQAQCPLFAATLYEVTLGVSSFLVILLLTEWKLLIAASHGMIQPLGMWLRSYVNRLRCN